MPDRGTLRLDVWLDVACVYRTRSEAQRACNAGKVAVNGQNSKPHRLVRVGDEVRLSRPYGRRQTVIIRGISDRHLPKREARSLYDDITPQPSAEELEMRRLERLYRSTLRAVRSPDKRERRALRKLKGR